MLQSCRLANAVRPKVERREYAWSFRVDHNIIKHSTVKYRSIPSQSYCERTIRSAVRKEVKLSKLNEIIVSLIFYELKEPK